MSVLAHELGHHVAFHTEVIGNDHKYELEADYFSGFVLRRLGATLAQSHAAMQALSPKEATSTHPALNDRLQVITVGWTDAGLSGAPRGLQERGAQVSTSPPSGLVAAGSVASGISTGAKKLGESFRDCQDCPEMVVLAPGEFLLGSPKDEVGRNSDEGPQQKIAMGRAFAVGKYEVTFDEWDACVAAGGCKHNPPDEGWGRGRRPVVNVSWWEAVQYTIWVSKRSGRKYRLLSEVEWEFSARAGTATPYSTGTRISVSQARFTEDEGTSGNGPVSVGSFPPNGFGLFDLHGNVIEWVADCYTEDYAGVRVGARSRSSDENCKWRGFRGGGWRQNSGLLRSAWRGGARPSISRNDLGFRVACDLAP